jgi:pyrimidine operon attenuation protein / uracil phosphoribosyltransferase
MKDTESNNIDKLIEKISKEIIENQSDISSLVLVGIVTRGYPIAKRIANFIENSTQKKIPVAKLDITLYRDDLSLQKSPLEIQETELNQDITNKTIILVDDVFFHGRTARAAIEAVLSHGRAKKIELAILVDRGYREIPIMANYTGVTINTKEKDNIKILLTEIDGKDIIIINE